MLTSPEVGAGPVRKVAKKGSPAKAPEHCQPCDQQPGAWLQAAVAAVGNGLTPPPPSAWVRERLQENAGSIGNFAAWPEDCMDCQKRIQVWSAAFDSSLDRYRFTEMLALEHEVKTLRAHVESLTRHRVALLAKVAAAEEEILNVRRQRQEEEDFRRQAEERIVVLEDGKRQLYAKLREAREATKASQDLVRTYQVQADEQRDLLGTCHGLLQRLSAGTFPVEEIDTFLDTRNFFPEASSTKEFSIKVSSASRRGSRSQSVSQRQSLAFTSAALSLPLGSRSASRVASRSASRVASRRGSVSEMVQEGPLFGGQLLGASSMLERQASNDGSEERVSYGRRGSDASDLMLNLPEGLELDGQAIEEEDEEDEEEHAKQKARHTIIMEHVQALENHGLVDSADDKGFHIENLGGENWTRESILREMTPEIICMWLQDKLWEVCLNVAEEDQDCLALSMAGLLEIKEKAILVDKEARKTQKLSAHVADEPSMWSITLAQMRDFYEAIKDDLKSYAASHDEIVTCTPIRITSTHICLKKNCKHEHRGTAFKPRSQVSRREEDKVKKLFPDSMLVVDRFIRPDSGNAAMALKWNPGGRKADTFVSYSMHEPFEALVETLEFSLTGAENIWISIFSLPQNGATLLPSDLLVASFVSALQEAKCLVLVVDPDLTVLDRAWCIFEVSLAQHFRVPVVPQFHDLAKLNQLDAKLLASNPFQAQCSLQTDFQKICSAWAPFGGPVTQVDHLKAVLQDRLGFYRSMEQLDALSETQRKIHVAVRHGDHSTLADLKTKHYKLLGECAAAVEERAAEAQLDVLEDQATWGGVVEVDNAEDRMIQYLHHTNPLLLNIFQEFIDAKLREKKNFEMAVQREEESHDHTKSDLAKEEEIHRDTKQRLEFALREAESAKAQLEFLEKK